MSEDRLERRVRAVERALTDGEADVAEVRARADLVDRVETLEADVEAIEDQLAELEAATEALRGYVGNVRSVNRDVEETADAALAAVERLEREVGVGPGREATTAGVEESAVHRTDHGPAASGGEPAAGGPATPDGGRGPATTPSAGGPTGDRPRAGDTTCDGEGSSLDRLLDRVRDALG